MSNKARRMLVLLLIILKEAGPTAACSSSCSSVCGCRSKGLTSVPQDLPTRIYWLFLGLNAITTLNQSDFSRYRSLRRLDLGSNQISMIHNEAFHNLPSLTDLYLYNNHLTNLRAGTFVGLGSLKKLSLHYNKLTSLPVDIFMGLGNLEYLYLARNKIHRIKAGTFKDTPKLRILELQHNNISTITVDTLGNFLQLQILDLSHNNINTFPIETLSNLNISALFWVTLEYNQLETIPSIAFDILHYVHIDNNPWQCDCRMALFQTWYRSSAYRFIRCAGPAYLTGQNLRDVNPEDLICVETTPVYSTSSTKHIVDSTPSLSPVSSSSPFHQSVSKVPASKALTMSPTPSNTPTADSTPGWSTVSTSPLFSPLAKSTSRVPTLSPTPSNTPTADFNPGWSTVSTDSPFSFQSTMTESNTDPADGGTVLSVPLLGTLGAILGLLLICTIAFTIQYMHKRRQRYPTSQQGFSNTNHTGPSSGHDQIRQHSLNTTNAEVNSQSGGSEHIYNVPIYEDPDTYQSESPHRGAGNRQSLDRFGPLVLPPSLPPRPGNQTGLWAASQMHFKSVDAAARTASVAGLSQRSGFRKIQHLHSSKVPSPSMRPGEGQQSHKYVNSHVIAAAKDAAAGTQLMVYENDDETESANKRPQSHKYVNSQMTAAAKDAAASPKVIMYENEDEIESASKRLKSHKYVNSHVAAAAKDAVAVPQVMVYENDDEMESANKRTQSHKYVNSHVAAAAKDAAAGLQVIVYDNDDESVKNKSKTAAVLGADRPHHYEPLRNPSSQQHTYTSLMPHGLQNQLK